MTKPRGMVATLAVLFNALIAVAGGIVLVHLSRASGHEVSPSQASDLHYLSESMLIGENVVPPLAGTSWGSMVAVPRGSAAPVNPPECALFLSQGDAVQKALAMRSSQSAAIGVELAIDDQRVDLATLRDTCAFFTLDSPGVRSSVRLDRTCIAGLVDGAISTLMHSKTTTKGASVAWEIAMIAGYHRGVLVTAEYTPGPRGGPFDSKVASTLPALFEAQVKRLDAVS
jgi:hypothetical protein